MISTRVNLSEPVIKGVNLFAVVYLWLCTNNQLSDSNFEKKKRRRRRKWNINRSLSVEWSVEEKHNSGRSVV